MSRITSLTVAKKEEKSNRQIAIIQRGPVSEFNPTFPGDIQALLRDDVHPSFEKFLLFWTMMDTIKVHGYSRAAMSAIGRATVGAWWKLSKHEEWGKEGTERQRRRLYKFYTSKEREWDNIKDFQSLAYKLLIGAMYLRFFGQVAYHLVRNKAGQVIGLDHLTGMVVPYVDEFGYFKEPAFIQYPSKDPRIRVEFKDQRELVFITNPDWEGSPLGGSDIEALTNYSLPLDIYLQTAAREYLKNSTRPELIFMLPADISDDAFEAFVAQLTAKYAGSQNIGKNPVAVQGELKIERVDDLPKGLPYQESRNSTREEILAVAGTGGALLGLTESISSANIREMRRQFHEITMEPLFKLLEQGFYEQVHVREFNTPGWIWGFNNPDFLTAVERATVHMRYLEQGVLNPNEAREELGLEPREGGDEYAAVGSGGEAQGSPPEGREDEPDDPSETGEPTDDDQDPDRGDQHDDETGKIIEEVENWEEAEELATTFQTEVIGQLIAEIQAWRKFAIKRFKRGRKLRRYHTDNIPEEVAFLLQADLEGAKDLEEIKILFNDVLEYLKDLTGLKERIDDENKRLEMY